MLSKNVPSRLKLDPGYECDICALRRAPKVKNNVKSRDLRSLRVNGLVQANDWANSKHSPFGFFSSFTHFHYSLLVPWFMVY